MQNNKEIFPNDEFNIVKKLIEKARKAQQVFESKKDQNYFDTACSAVAWTVMEPKRNKFFSKLAVAETGLGNIEDKIKKNHNKTLGLLRDLKDVKSFGHIREDLEKGINYFLRPKGVIGSVVPSTNPIATPVNNIINSLKTGNAIILAPSPKGAGPLSELIKSIHKELNKVSVPIDLVQMLPSPPSKKKTEYLMKLVDLVIVTGSQNNVRAGYSSGTPAIGVGMGNVVSIIDETADVVQAAVKIASSKIFDNATSCSSENSIIAVEENYQKVINNLRLNGGYLLNSEQVSALEKLHWKDKKITTKLLAKDISTVVDELKIKDFPKSDIKFLIAPSEGVGPDFLLSGEKMALFLTLYKAKDFEEAKKLAILIQDYQGAGHSLSIHSTNRERINSLALEVKACRIIVNQAHTFANGGFFNNGLPFSLSMGCGSWGGNSIDDNLNWKHFVNEVKIVRTIPENKPSLDDVFSDYWEKYGK